MWNEPHVRFPFLQQIVAETERNLVTAQTETTVNSNELVPTAAPSLDIEHTEYINEPFIQSVGRNTSTESEESCVSRHISVNKSLKM